KNCCAILTASTALPPSATMSTPGVLASNFATPSRNKGWSSTMAVRIGFVMWRATEGRSEELGVHNLGNHLCVIYSSITWRSTKYFIHYRLSRNSCASHKPRQEKSMTAGDVESGVVRFVVQKLYVQA